MIEIQQDAINPRRWYLDFDAAAPGGLGGACLLLDLANSFVSIDGVHRNELMPKYSTGKLLGEGLTRVGMPMPTVVELYNIQEPLTLAALGKGTEVSGTVCGRMISALAKALGGSVRFCELIQDEDTVHIWAHLSFE
jgi:hypothetical protein